MIIQDVLYVAFSTILVMVALQIVTFLVMKLLYPPEPKIIYRDSVQYVQPPAPLAQPAPPQHVPPVLTQNVPEVQLPEYEPRKPASTSVRMDPELPAGIQETRPPGT